MSDECVKVSTVGFFADGAELDSNGVVWTVERIDGWWDSAPVRVSRREVPPTGEITTAVRENGRALVVWLGASSGDPSTALGALCFTAMDSIDAFWPSTHLFLMIVEDPVLTLKARVRRVGQINKRILGDLAAVQVQIPLLAPDPYRYDLDDNPFD